MTPEKIIQLASKVKSGEATQEEELAMLVEINKTLSTMREAIQVIKNQGTEDVARNSGN